MKNKSKIKCYYKKVSLMLVLGFLLTNLLGAVMVFAEPSFTINPTAMSGSSTKRITVTSTENSFTLGEATPFIMKNGSVESSASISSVDSTSTEVSFTLGSGLPDGSYDVRIVDPNGTFECGSITIGEPSISGTDVVSVSKDYTNQNFSVVGVNTNFALGQTTVEILDSNDEAVNFVDSITEISDSFNLTIRLKDGLDSGTYSVRVSTDDEIVTANDVLVVRGIATAQFSVSSISEGYSTTTIDVTGTNTGFDQNQTTISITGQSSAVGTITVSSETELSFSLNSGLGVGSYTVIIKTGSEEVESVINVNVASAELEYQGNDFSQIAAGYGSVYNLVLEGTDTSFASGTTQLSLFSGDPDGSGVDVTSTYVSNASVSSSTSLSFQLGTGLGSGTYYVRAITDNQTVEDTFVVLAPSLSEITYNSDVVSGSNVPLGYKKMTINVIGSNTVFEQGTTTVEIQGESDKIETIVVEDSTNISFSLKEGLVASNYTILIDVDGDTNTTSDQITSQFTVTTPSLDSISVETIINVSSIPKTLTVIALNSNFTSAIPDVKIIDDQSAVLNDAQISNITVVSDTKLTFDLIPNSITTQGSYGIKITTTSNQVTETITENPAFVVDSSGIDLNPSFVYADELGTKEITITGYNTNFASGNTTVSINGTEVATANVKSTVNIEFVIPEGLSDGTHTLTVIDADSNTHTASIITDTRSVSISPTEKNAGYGSFKMTVSADGITFNTTDAKPTISISGSGSVTVNDNEINTTEFTFDFPTGLSAGNYTVTITYEGFSFNKTFTVNAVDSGGDTPTDGGDSGGDSGGVPIFIPPFEEVVEVEETITESSEIDKTENVIEFDNGMEGKEIIYDSVSAIEAIKLLTEDSFNVVEDEYSNVEVSLSSDVMKALKDKSEDMNIVVKSDIGEYILPVELINLDELKSKLGSVDVSIAVIIKKSSAAVTSKMNAVASSKGATVLATPVEFIIEASAGDNKVEINSFKAKYVSRKITLSGNIDVNKTVGVKFDEMKNKYIPVPTKFYKDESGNFVAELKKKDNSIYTVIEKQKTFGDIVSHWAKNNIETLASKMIINGMTENEFAPDKSVTRAQFATLLVNALGLEGTGTSSKFSDVFNGDWYAAAVNTAVSEGLVAGYSDKTFKPNKTINREEMAIMIVRGLRVAEKNSEISTSEKNTLLIKFNDKETISSWAEEEVAVAVKENIINGKTANTFVPKDNATRAEAATMLTRMMKAADFIN